MFASHEGEEIALHLARYVGNTELFWLNLQARFDLDAQRDVLGARPEREVVPFERASFSPFPPSHRSRMPPDQKPKGPASYFPSIEKTYGQPIAHWLDLARGRRGMKHMEIVGWLKAEHGLGHGHANAVVAYVLAEAR